MNSKHMDFVWNKEKSEVIGTYLKNWSIYTTICSTLGNEEKFEQTKYSYTKW